MSISFNDASNIMLSGAGGGVYIGDHVTSAQIKGTDINHNGTNGLGGGVYIQGGSVQDGIQTTVNIDDCRIYWNDAENGGGIAITKDNLNVANSSITNNHATVDATRGYGGGVYIDEAVTAVSFSNSLLGSNTATTSGGGIWIWTPQAASTITVTLDNTSVVGNSAAFGGGGIGVSGNTVEGSVQLLLKNGTYIAYNSLTDQNSVGGGLFLGNGTVTFDGITFDSNTAAFATGFFAASNTEVIEGPGGATFNNDSWFIEP